MKLIKRDDTHFTFLIGKREREMLFALLRRYPVVIAAHFRTRHPGKADEARDHLHFLEEALAEQQREHRKELEQMLTQSGRFTENDLGFTFRLDSSELEWLLQVLNDIRVGSWVQLGEPNPDSAPQIALTEQNMQLAWAMEMAGLFQHSLLEATQSPQ